MTFTVRSLRALTDFVFQKKYRKLDIFFVTAGLLVLAVAHFQSNPEFRQMLGADMNSDVATQIVVSHMTTRDCSASLKKLYPVEIVSERRVDDQFVGIFKVRAEFQFVPVPLQQGIPPEYIQGVITCNVQMLQLHEAIQVDMGDTLSFLLQVEAWKLVGGSWKVLSIEEI